MARLFFVLLFLFALFYFYAQQPVYGEQICVGERTWDLGVGPNSPDICSTISINNSCNGSDYWLKTGQQCCNERYGTGNTACQGSITNKGPGTPVVYTYKCCYEVTPTPTPIPPCVLNGGQCIPLSPCSLGRVQSSFSCGGSGVCCVVPTPTPTPTPTPAGKVVIEQYQCNGTGTKWDRVPITNACVPLSSCSNPLPTPTLTPIPPTPTPVPPCGALGQICCGGTNCNVSLRCAVDNICESIPPTPTPTPTPTPIPCSVTTSPGTHNLVVGGTGTVTASVNPGGLGTAAISRMDFGSYNTSIATVSPTSDFFPPSWATTVTAVAVGNTAVWATAYLSDRRVCESTGGTDTNINVLAPTPIPTPSCTNLFSCGACQPSDSCGWCFSSNQCKRGTPSGSNDGLCTGSNWGYFSCVAPTPTLTPFGGNGQPCSLSRTCNPGLQCEADGFCGPIPPTPTPTIPPTVTIQGRNVDANGNALTTNIGQSITISGLINRTSTSFGAWNFTNIPGGTYTVSANVPTSYSVSFSFSGINTSPPTAPYTSGSSLPVSLPGNGNWADIYFRYALLHNISGRVYYDDNHNGVWDGPPIDRPYNGAGGSDVLISGTPGPLVYAINPGTGMYTTANIYIMGNTYSLQLRNIPAGCSSSPQSITIVNADAPGNFPLQNCALPTPTPTPTPVPLYSISGKMFNDTNRDEKSIGDTNYIGAVTITRSPALGSYSSPVGTGIYSLTNLPSGQYTITFSGLPQGYEFTYPPLSGLPPSNSFIINIPCSNPPGEASCTLGNVINLNSGVANSVSAWVQTTGSDLRWDSGFNNPLPSANTYASVPGTGGMPGVIFSGASTPILGSGQASSSQFNWKVGGSSSESREVFTDTHSLIPTSYRFLLETAQSSGINPATITTLDSSLTHGIYKVEGDFTLTGATYTFGTGNFIILVNGNLNINRKIIVPVGSTAMFSAKGNITVNRNVGEAGASSTCNITNHFGCSIEGLYSADNNFIADGLKDCSVGPDLRLNIAGSVIANAGRPQTNGTFVNNRTLCRGNTSNPSVNFIERPDFMLNYPSFVTQTTRSWQDEKP